MNFKNKIEDSILSSIETKHSLLSNCSEDIEKLGIILGEAVKKGNKILFCGNGGSAADAQHLAAELVVRLRPDFNRKALPGLALTVDSSVLTAGGNDYGFDTVFARSVEAFAKPGDILIGISTSGNSKNVQLAIEKANELGVESIGLLGKDGGYIKDYCTYSLIIPSNNTARIQESHILVGHIWCEMIEEIACEL
jgi:D-sedoheptulose 7-phosphate isomerase